MNRLQLEVIIILIVVSGLILFTIQNPSQSTTKSELRLDKFSTILLPVGEVSSKLESATKIGRADESRLLNILIFLQYDIVGQQAYADSVSDPNSPNYRNYITPEESAERFGLSAVQIEEVTNYLQENGITIYSVSNNMVITTSVTVSQAEKLFHTTINEYEITLEGNTEPTRFIANATPPMLPENIAKLVSVVSGLDRTPVLMISGTSFFPLDAP